MKNNYRVSQRERSAAIFLRYKKTKSQKNPAARQLGSSTQNRYAVCYRNTDDALHSLPSNLSALRICFEVPEQGD